MPFSLDVIWDGQRLISRRSVQTKPCRLSPAEYVLGRRCMPSIRSGSNIEKSIEKCESSSDIVGDSLHRSGWPASEAASVVSMPMRLKMMEMFSRSFSLTISMNDWHRVSERGERIVNELDWVKVGGWVMSNEEERESAVRIQRSARSFLPCLFSSSSFSILSSSLLSLSSLLHLCLFNHSLFHLSVYFKVPRLLTCWPH